MTTDTLLAASDVLVGMCGSVNSKFAYLPPDRQRASLNMEWDVARLFPEIEDTDIVTSESSRKLVIRAASNVLWKSLSQRLEPRGGIPSPPGSQRGRITVAANSSQLQYPNSSAHKGAALDWMSVAELTIVAEGDVALRVPSVCVHDLHRD